MSLSRYDRNRGRISRRDTSITSTNRGYAASHADSVPDWVKVRRSVATREDLMQFHDYLSNQMRHIYGTIKADGDELAQDTVKTLKWFDGKLQEEHGKMLQTISQLKEAHQQNQFCWSEWSAVIRRGPPWSAVVRRDPPWYAVVRRGP